MILKDKNEFDFILNNLKHNECDFDIIYSSSKIQIVESGYKYIYYPNKLKNIKGLNFIKTVKDHIEKNNISYPFDKTIRYNKLNLSFKKSVYYKKDVYEIDLKSAYWRFAWQNDFISYEIYKQGLNIDKKIRLMSLGALAKQQTMFTYENGILKGKPLTIKSENTEGIFFKVAYDTDQIMKQLINVIDPKNFFFYWVDAVFFSGKDNLVKVEQKLNELDLNYKIVPIKKLIRKANLIQVEDFDFKVRDFNFSRQTTTKGLI